MSKKVKHEYEMGPDNTEFLDSVLYILDNSLKCRACDMIGHVCYGHYEAMADLLSSYKSGDYEAGVS